MEASSPARRPARLGWLCCGSAALALAVAAGLQVSGWQRRPDASRGVHLAAVLPAALNGTAAVALPLGPTEAGDEIVRRVLKCDDVFYRSYTSSRGAFELYVAYWAPNRIPTELVAAHTPDRCWSDNGWRCTEMKFGQRLSVGAQTLLPAEERTFVSPDGATKVYVLYWHDVGGRPYPYGASFNWSPNPFQYWRRHADYILFGAPEQYFVRLTSRVPWSELWRDSSVQEAMARVATLALCERHLGGDVRPE